MIGLISRLVDLIAWSARRSAMDDVTLSLLDGKHRVAEDVFDWNRPAVEVGINEFQTGISCMNFCGGYYWWTYYCNAINLDHVAGALPPF